MIIHLIQIFIEILLFIIIFFFCWCMYTDETVVKKNCPPTRILHILGVLALQPVNRRLILLLTMDPVPSMWCFLSQLRKIVWFFLSIVPSPFHLISCMAVMANFYESSCDNSILRASGRHSDNIFHEPTLKSFNPSQGCPWQFDPVFASLYFETVFFIRGGVTWTRIYGTW